MQAGFNASVKVGKGSSGKMGGWGTSRPAAACGHCTVGEPFSQRVSRQIDANVHGAVADPRRALAPRLTSSSNALV